VSKGEKDTGFVLQRDLDDVKGTVYTLVLCLDRLMLNLSITTLAKDYQSLDTAMKEMRKALELTKQVLEE
jgi:hypothetical protein